jgi:two-component system sensor histidine kinase BaeS
MKIIHERLGAKLFLANLVVILAGLVILALTIHITIPAAFNHHMGQMNSAMMNGMEQGQGRGHELGRTLFDNFRASMFESLGYAATASVLAALLVSFFLSRRIVAPVQTLTAASQSIAAGHYEERVAVKGSDEIAQLALHFNQMAAQLEQVESMRRRLIGDVSHELRTPLTAIKGSMEGLIDGVLPANDETYRQIHTEAERLNRLVNDLQELSRVEAHAYELDLRALDVSSLIHSVTKRLAAQFEAKRIALDLDLPAHLPHVLADEDRTIQVLTNLTGNALQYTPEGGDIKVSAKRSNDEIQIAIHDTGIGIPPEHLTNIFDRFYRVDKSRSRQAGGGSGIGLTVARALVEAHGGRIWAESNGIGQGSTFTFSLKIAE